MLRIVYSNDMVRLATHLANVQQSEPLPVLQTETVIVQSNELARWLSLLLANQHGIASNLEFPYPSAYIWSLFRQMLPDVPVDSSYSKEVLAWRIFALLPECRQQAGFEPVDHYLGEKDDPLKCYQLAHRIADSFDQYLMYRPDWILQWEQGQTPHWQAKLWQLLTGDDAEPLHRASLLQQMQEILASVRKKPDFLPQRLSIIGISTMPPVYLRLFELIARFCDVTLYFLSPSQSYWGDLFDRKKQAQQLSLLRTDEEVLVGDHPLLAGLGRQGQTFFELVQGCEHQAYEEYIAPDSRTLLGQLQYDIFSLRKIDAAHKMTVSPDDKSIQIHSCHSAMREIEVLHDQLLAMFEADNTLSPTDIVVMTPDIEQYAPAIDAVFSSQPEYHRIPYSIADCGLRYQSQFINQFLLLLDLPQTRFTVESVVSLMQVPAVGRRFDLDEQAISTIRDWLTETHICWGLDGQDKLSFDLPANPANTWRAGLDRLLLAFAMPQANQPGRLFENRLAFDVISGERATILGKLCAFIDTLDHCRTMLSTDKTIQQWQHSLNKLLDELFTLDQGEHEQAATQIRHSMQKLVDSVEVAGVKQKLSFSLIKDWLGRQLDSEKIQSRFMGHGMTFCGMVPMRSIPFKVVCLIGMNDDSYPRRQFSPGFDLLDKDFRAGDRLRRDDDRYLFLEAVLSARSTLYISYVGASIHDNSHIPPSVLVSDLRDVLNLSCWCDGYGDIWTKLLTEHPLQAFSRRYFDGSDHKLFSYQQNHSQQPVQQQPDWFIRPLPEADDSWRQLSVSQLLSFYRHPARFLMSARLNVKLELDEQQLDKREPFELDNLQAWQLRQQILEAELQRTEAEAIQQYIEASGLLPQGSLGQQVYQQQHDKVKQFVETLLPAYPDNFLPTAGIDLKTGDFHINGQLHGLSRQGLFFYRMSKRKGHHLLFAWINHLLLNIVKPAGVSLQTQLLCEDRHYQFTPIVDAETYLQQLLQYYWQGLHEPLPFFAVTSFEFARAMLDKDSKADPQKKARSSWLENPFNNSGEAQDSYYQLLYRNAPLDDQFEQLALRIYQPLKKHLAGNKL